MGLPRPSVLLSVLNTVHSVPSSGPISYTSSFIRSPCTGTRHRREQHRDNCRTYATIANDGRGIHEKAEGGYRWPDAPTGRSCPTPYQILELKKDAVYTKTRYYELVKIYHPDRGSFLHHSTLPETVKTERYRLIVTAHAILSDPTKRAAYDRFGAGWEGRADADRQSAPGENKPGPFSHSWHEYSASYNDSIWRNATWEDWERWRSNQYDEHGQRRPPQAPVYFKNAYFIAVVGMFAILGSSINYNRAQDASTYFVEQRDIVHDMTAKDLRKVRADVYAKARDDRVEWFLRNREAAVETGQFGEAGLQKLQEERNSRMMIEREVCQSEEIAESHG
ncbi:hypothetical protein K431DRAFT_323307 [Polychaeton citri CBS 116435]|uniref:J domain-containing protein n=1 Tax=Polychaeton citri CBS 116435 TaxID=1314669 RepID=A0A9P4Q004_9PEZI|nr:hypothetical protein K431DRAFT_323307 [Polychaeton citri CBS 116435]